MHSRSSVWSANTFVWSLRPSDVFLLQNFSILSLLLSSLVMLLSSAIRIASSMMSVSCFAKSASVRLLAALLDTVTRRLVVTHPPVERLL